MLADGAVSGRPEAAVIVFAVLARRGDAPLLRYVEVGVAPSCHTEVAESTWLSDDARG